MRSRKIRKGSVLITCTIFLVVFMALAVGVASMSGDNMLMANNQHQGNQAFASAESGLEVVRYWLSRVRIPSSTPAADYLPAVIQTVQSDLKANSISNIAINSDGAIPPVVVESTGAQRFSGHLAVSSSEPNVIHVYITGESRQASRTIKVEYSITPYHFPIFNYGMATKGPLNLEYNPRFLAATEGWEADIYVESPSSLIAVDIGNNATFAGDIDIGNPQASVSCGGTLDLGGEVHMLQPEDRPEFPIPDVQRFRQYATGPVIGPGSDISGSSITLANAMIHHGTNPKFPGNITIQGILYIEAPNTVTFSRNTTVQGMIVAEGDAANPATNQINFGDPMQPSVPSNFSSGPYPPGAQFDAIRGEVGSCILAPGFAVSFWKNFAAINGVIAASGLRFDNNATATVLGTLINYSEQPTVVTRNINMTFDRSAMVEIPAGFDLLRVLTYKPSSYSVVP